MNDVVVIPSVSPEQAWQLANGALPDPFSVLGIHALSAAAGGFQTWVIRAFLPAGETAGSVATLAKKREITTTAGTTTPAIATNFVAPRLVLRSGSPPPRPESWASPIRLICPGRPMNMPIGAGACQWRWRT